MGGALALMGVKEPWPASVPVAQKQERDWETAWKGNAAA
jgi:hypothetical protein